MHDFLGDLFVLFGVDRDHASPVHTVENGIHGLGCADNGDDTVHGCLNLTKHQNGSTDNHKIHQHDCIAGLHIRTELLQKLGQDIAAARCGITHEDQCHADSGKNSAERAGDQTVSFILPYSGRRDKILDHTHPDNRADRFESHFPVQ